MFKLAQITDLHLRHHVPGNASMALRRSVGGLPRLREALQRIRKAGADMVVLTGDIVDVPMFMVEGMPGGFLDPQNEQDWSSLVLKDYQAVKDVLNESGLPWMILPGNHDHWVLFNKVFPPSPPVTFKGYRLVTFYDYEGRDYTPRRLGDSRALFNEVLADSDPTPQIHLQHYLMHAIREGGYPHSYAEKENLRQAIAQSGKVRLSLSGHYHYGNACIEEGNTQYHVSLSFCEHPFHWRMFEITSTEIHHQYYTMEENTELKGAVFLDRDGVINDIASYYFGPERFHLIPGSAQAIRRLNEKGIPVVVVTAQSCIGVGRANEAVVHAVHEQMNALLSAHGAWVDAVYYTKGAGPNSVLPHYASLNTNKGVLVKDAAKQLHLDLSRSWVIGDRKTDIAAAVDNGAKGILVHTGDGLLHRPEVEQAFPGTPQFADLNAAVDWLINEQGL